LPEDGIYGQKVGTPRYCGWPNASESGDYIPVSAILPKSRFVDATPKIYIHMDLGFSKHICVRNYLR
jgi:hypothetical protein